MKKLLIALIASNVIMLSAVAMAPSRRSAYPKSSSIVSTVDVEPRLERSYAPAGTSRRITAEQAEKSRRLVYPSAASVKKEQAAAIRSVYDSKPE